MPSECLCSDGIVITELERVIAVRLFHVSEEADIKVFEPRIPDRDDMDKNVGLVWAIDEERLPNFLTPRNCPRVTYHIGKNTTQADIQKFFVSPTVNHAVIIENRWLEQMRSTTLYLYEFDVSGFELQDEIAGYYVSKSPQKPKEKYVINDLLAELIKRNVEITITDNLWNIADEIKKTTLNWSLCRMGYAQPRK